MSASLYICCRMRLLSCRRTAHILQKPAWAHGPAPGEAVAAKTWSRSTLNCLAARKERLIRAIRPVPIKVITVSKGNSHGTTAMAGEWAEKLRRYTQLTVHQVKSNPKRASDPEVIKTGEGERVLKLLTPQDLVVVLDERGKGIDSEALADLLAEAGDNSFSSISFCIGGPYGHADAVRQRGNKMLRLSSLVLNHQVAAVVLLEALYRSHTILRGEPYHH